MECLTRMIDNNEILKKYGFTDNDINYLSKMNDSFYKNSVIKGILFGSIYVIIYKLLFLIMLVVFSVNLFKIIKCVIDRIVYKNNNKESLVVFIKRSVIFIGIVLILDIILYFVGGKLVNLFNFLIS